MPGQHESSSTMRVILPTEARMRGDDRQQAGMWSYLPLEQRVPPDHPLRPIRGMVDGVLAELSPRFGELYSRVGRPSIAPEKLLRALLLQVLYTIRSERLLMEQLDYNLLFRWFVGLEMDDPVWNATVFTRTESGCSPGRSPGGSLIGWWPKPGSGACSPTSTSPWTEHWWRRGPASKASNGRTRRRRCPMTRAIRRWISTASAAATPPMRPQRIPTRGSRAKAKGRKPSSSTPATC